MLNDMNLAFLLKKLPFAFICILKLFNIAFL